MEREQVKRIEAIWGDLKEMMGSNLGELDSRGNTKAFNPAGYMLQMVEGLEKGREISRVGLKRDLEAVMAEVILGTGLRRVEGEVVEGENGSLEWLAPGHEGKGKGDVLAVIGETVRREEVRADDEGLGERQRKVARARAKRWELEGRQVELILKELEEDKESWVVGVLPKNETVYPASEINYVTIYGLERKGEEWKIVSYPLVNRYSERLLSKLLGEDKKVLSEEELITRVKKVRIDEPEELVELMEGLVTEEERSAGKTAVLIDRTKEVEAGEEVVDGGGDFLAAVLEYELERLVGGDDWLEVRNRLDVAGELVLKNIIGFLENERYLNKEELMVKVEWYIECAEGMRSGFRQRFLGEIVRENEMEVLTRAVGKMGPCGSVELGGMEGALSGSAIENVKKMEGEGCCICGSPDAICGYCDNHKHLAPPG